MNRPAGCEGCPLNTKSVPGFCPDKIPAGVRILLLAEAPGKNEIIEAEPMVGKAGFVLKEWLLKAVPQLQLAKERGQVGFANVLRCLPPEVQGRPYPKGQDREQSEAHCRQYDNWSDNIKTYILFGEASQRLLFKDELDAEDAEDRQLGHDVKGVMGRIGRVYEREGKRYIFAPHPAFILRQPALVQHGQEALKIAANTDQNLEVNYMRWEDALKQIA